MRAVVVKVPNRYRAAHLYLRRTIFLLKRIKKTTTIIIVIIQFRHAKARNVEKKIYCPANYPSTYNNNISTHTVRYGGKKNRSARHACNVVGLRSWFDCLETYKSTGSGKYGFYAIRWMRLHEKH
jgi:hypothetical protein